MDKRTLSLRLRSLTVFRGLLKDPVVDALLACMECPREDLSGFVSAYSEFVARLYEAGYADLTEYVRSRVEDSENPLIRLRCAGRQEPPQRGRRPGRAGGGGGSHPTIFAGRHRL